MKRYIVNIVWQETHEDDIEVRARDEEHAKEIAYELIETTRNNLKSTSLIESEVVDEKDDYDGPDTLEEAEGIR